MQLRLLTLLVVAGLQLLPVCHPYLGTTFAEENSQARPFLAIWQDDAGSRTSDAPYIRIAIWNDGRILFAQNATKWNHDLRQGRVDVRRISELKNAIEATGVFKLRDNCYLVPDAASDCMMLDLGEKQQMLYWDEVEHPGYGISIAAKPHHLKFKECWKKINSLALAAIPKESQPFGERFRRPPKSWRLKQAIQSG